MDVRKINLWLDERTIQAVEKFAGKLAKQRRQGERPATFSEALRLVIANGIPKTNTHKTRRKAA